MNYPVEKERNFNYKNSAWKK